MTRTFVLQRDEDVSNVSGIGIVADGAAFPNGKVVVAWTGKHPSVITYDSVDAVLDIHGHEGKTRIVWDDVPEINKALGEAYHRGAVNGGRSTARLERSLRAIKKLDDQELPNFYDLALEIVDKALMSIDGPPDPPDAKYGS